MQPKTQYAKSGELNIAYQVIGEGPLDLVFTFGWASHLDFQWTEPTLTRFLRRLAKFARVIVFDKRGVGLSDPLPRAATLEERMDDIDAVMNAAGSERAVLLGYSEGGAMAALYAAAHPERTSALVMYETWVSGLLDVERNPGGEKWIQVDREVRESIEHWGEGHGLAMGAPSLAASQVERRMYGAFERAAMSPGMAAALWDSFVQEDIREVLPAVLVPTLVIHHTGSRIPVENAHYAAEKIPGARLVELEGIDHLPITHDADGIAEEIEEFLTGTRQSHDVDRVLATILFTDIVGSTDLAARLGDRAWLDLLARHDSAVRAEVDRFGGEVVKHTGDGFLATFDGPARASLCAAAIRERLRDLDIEVRAGLHTGEFELLATDVGGVAVHIAARVMAEAGAGEILASRAVKNLAVKSGIRFASRGRSSLKGVPGRWELFAVDEEQARPAQADIGRDPASLNDRIARGIARRAPALARTGARVMRRQATG
jgi:class 3 adenylate cyclase